MSFLEGIERTEIGNFKEKDRTFERALNYTLKDLNIIQ